MKLARKLSAALVFGVLLVMAGYAYLQVRQEVVLFDADFQRARQLGLAWIGMLEAVWEHEGPARARELASRADARAGGVIIRLLALDDSVTDLAKPALGAADLQVLASGGVVRTVQQDGDDQWRHIYAPITVAGAHPVAVELIEPLTHQQRFIHTSHVALTFATLTVVAVCGLVATGLELWFVGRPLRLLRDKARRAGAGDFSQPLVLRQRDEIGELAGEFNAMCERLADANRRLAAATEARMAALEQMRHTDRLATVGQLAAGVAHELGTPLNVVSARAQLIGTSPMSQPDVQKNAQIIVDQADRMTEIIQQLLDFSRRRAVKPALTNLQKVVTRTLDLLSSSAERARVLLRCEAPAQPVLAYVDQNQLQQALTNVILNGIQAMPAGGQLLVRVGTQYAHPPDEPGGSDHECVCVTIEDSGIGMAPEHVSRIFEPFFTTKPVGDGTGLGLAVTHGIIAEHGGWIAVHSTVGEGSRFSIFLPSPAASDADRVEVAS